jgi:ceramide glucosyltransferase
MTPAFLILAAIAILSIGHFGSIGLAFVRARRGVAPLQDRPPISIVRTACGIENYGEATLASGFAIAYPRYELIFCVADEADPVVPVIRRLIAAHGDIDAKLLIGDDRISVNPKLNNLVKGVKAARYDWIVMSDSNVLIPPDYLDRLMAESTSDTGLVCGPPVGVCPEGLGAELECAFLNTYAQRWQLVSDALGGAFAQGKTMLWRREDLDRVGGVQALAAEPAEDAAATKLLANQGLGIRLVPRSFPQPLGHRSMTDALRRQLRWARLRRVSFPLSYATEITSCAIFPIAAAVVLGAIDVVPLWTVLVFVAAWYGGELALARLLDWPVSARIAAMTLVRDIALPFLWAAGWTGNTLLWRGHAFNAAAPHRQVRRRAFAAGWRPARATNAMRALASINWRHEPAPIRTLARLLTTKR